MARITVFRENQQLRGKALAANTVASFLVAQGKSSLPDLSETWVMNAELLTFLNRPRALDHWCDLGRLLPRGGGYVLTRHGLDTVLNREANEARGASGKRNAFNVSPELVRLARLFILTGRTQEPSGIEVLSMTLDVDIPEGDWSP